MSFLHTTGLLLSIKLIYPKSQKVLKIYFPKELTLINQSLCVGIFLKDLKRKYFKEYICVRFYYHVFYLELLCNGCGCSKINNHFNFVGIF